MNAFLKCVLILILLADVLVLLILVAFGRHECSGLASTLWSAAAWRRFRPF
jgi:hypothetical protein